MKVFIVFSAIFMMGVTCIIYQGDVDRYMHDQETLKMIAEEAACRAALCLDYDAYGTGEKRFHTEEAEEAAYSAVEEGRKQLICGRRAEFNLDIVFEDDVFGYGYHNEEHLPGVTVSITALTDDFFRLPFLNRESITRKSKYEIKGL